jgi:hypothetical protein
MNDSKNTPKSSSEIPAPTTRTQQVPMRMAEYEDIWFMRPHDDGKGNKPSVPYGLNVWLENKQGNLECYTIKNKTMWADVESAIRLGRAWLPITTSIHH